MSVSPASVRELPNDGNAEARTSLPVSLAIWLH